MAGKVPMEPFSVNSGSFRALQCILSSSYYHTPPAVVTLNMKQRSAEHRELGVRAPALERVARGA